jgi:RND family efflux transporter MFP subunit
LVTVGKELGVGAVYLRFEMVRLRHPPSDSRRSLQRLRCPSMPRCVFLSAGLLLGCIALAHAAAPVEVGVQPLREVALPVSGTAPASVIAPNDSHIAAEVTAKVLRVHAEVGGTVSAGQLLLELDPADYRLALAQADAQVAAARARVALAEQRLRRAQSLKQRQFVADDEVLELETGVQAAHADLDVARAQRAIAARNVDKCRIVAPFAGVVLERQAQVGALALPGAILLRLVDLAPVEIEAQIQAAQAEALPQATDLVFESQGHRYPARLLRLSPVVEAAARTRVARLTFIDRVAPAGSSGTLRWTTADVLLPPELMVKRDQELGAFVVEDGRARFVPAPAAQEGRPFPVDLPPETWIVVRGHQALRDGQPVTVIVGAR